MGPRSLKNTAQLKHSVGNKNSSLCCIFVVVVFGFAPLFFENISLGMISISLGMVICVFYLLCNLLLKSKQNSAFILEVQL